MEQNMSGFCIRGGSVSANSGSTGTKCGRWNPTTEQVNLLTELFSSGLRTPTTSQIQKISTQLSFYGKIENKNVFYWFQNHKARERQKRRKVSFDDDDKDVNIRPENAMNFSTQNFAYHVSEPERLTQTLQLFPLNSFHGESETLKLGVHGNECRDTTMFSYKMGEQMDHPPLNLRLSFM
ncbi:hypothetical protein Lal_00001148 [Lupinus albus]|uniref:Putative transcription factor homeobox-WOX family n=1 Tax=Lupinus albus TaxID=3870 RepID=A0A6A5P188_LUPAL|nr:putative transcription factor homeobox-WOX family [Lupinus albus]KAF1891013.1 hypothetical protein Lal_00001148 [Lupinus albus]